VSVEAIGLSGEVGVVKQVVSSVVSMSQVALALHV